MKVVVGDAGRLFCHPGEPKPEADGDLPGRSGTLVKRRNRSQGAVCFGYCLLLSRNVMGLTGCGKRPFRTLLSLSVISPRGGELNTSGAERRSELTSPRGANQKGSNPALSQGGEDF